MHHGFGHVLISQPEKKTNNNNIFSDYVSHIVEILRTNDQMQQCVIMFVVLFAYVKFEM